MSESLQSMWEDQWGSSHNREWMLKGC